MHFLRPSWATFLLSWAVGAVKVRGSIPLSSAKRTPGQAGGLSFLRFVGRLGLVLRLGGTARIADTAVECVYRGSRPCHQRWNCLARPAGVEEPSVHADTYEGHRHDRRYPDERCRHTTHSIVKR